MKAPVLMLAGRYDYLTPIEESHRPLFNLFGTPADAKKLVIFNSGHVPERIELIRNILDWLDQYLGPVKMK